MGRMAGDSLGSRAGDSPEVLPRDLTIRPWVGAVDRDTAFCRGVGGFERVGPHVGVELAVVALVRGVDLVGSDSVLVKTTGSGNTKSSRLSTP